MVDRSWRSSLDRPRAERLAEFFRRLEAALPAESSQEAFDQLAAVLNEVEDEMTTIANQPELWQTDGRMYPPQPDSARSVEGHPGVTRFRSRGHNTFIGKNGAIEIQEVASNRLLFSKSGADERGVWDL